MTSPVFSSMMNSTTVILRKERTYDGQGGWQVSYVGVDIIRGRIRPASSSEKEAAQREHRDISHVLYAPHGSNIRRGDMVVVSDLVVEIDAVREPSKAGHHLEIDCLEKQVEIAPVAS